MNTGRGGRKKPHRPTREKVGRKEEKNGVKQKGEGIRLHTVETSYLSREKKAPSRQMNPSMKE